MPLRVWYASYAATTAETSTLAARLFAFVCVASALSRIFLKSIAARHASGGEDVDSEDDVAGAEDAF